MAKKRKKNKAQSQSMYSHAQGYMGQSMPWPEYAYPAMMPSQAQAFHQSEAPSAPTDTSLLRHAYGMPPQAEHVAGTNFAQQGQAPQQPNGMGLDAMGLGAGASATLNSNATNDPMAAYLKAAGLDTGLLQGLPNALRSRHTEQFLLGLLIGGAAAWVLTDEELRNKLLKTGLKLYSGLMGGLEELKEQVADVRAELDSEQHGGV